MKARSRSILWRLILLAIVVHAVRLVAQQDETIYDSDVNARSFDEMLYPPIARQARIQGTVVVRVKIDSAGRVTSANAISGAKLLIPDTLSNAKKWQFLPNVSKAAIIIYEFRLAEGK